MSNVSVAQEDGQSSAAQVELTAEEVERKALKEKYTFPVIGGEDYFNRLRLTYKPQTYWLWLSRNIFKFLTKLENCTLEELREWIPLAFRPPDDLLNGYLGRFKDGSFTWNQGWGIVRTLKKDGSFDVSKGVIDAGFSQASSFDRKDFRYHKDAICESGETTKVFKVINAQTKEQFILKQYQRDNEEDRLFQKELECAKFLNHKNIIKYDNVWTNDTNHELLLSFADAGDLDKFGKWLHSESQSKDAETVMKYTKEIVKQVLDGIDEMHSLGIVHGNIKPSNVLIKRGPEKKEDHFLFHCVISDFHFAQKCHGSELLQVTTTGAWPNAYSAPEMFETGKYTESADIWSLGITTYYLVCGYNCFSEGNSTLEATATTIKAGFNKRIEKDSSQKGPYFTAPLFCEKNCLVLIAACLKTTSRKRPNTLDLSNFNMLKKEDSLVSRKFIEATTNTMPMSDIQILITDIHGKLTSQKEKDETKAMMMPFIAGKTIKKVEFAAFMAMTDQSPERTTEVKNILSDAVNVDAIVFQWHRQICLFDLQTDVDTFRWHMDSIKQTIETYKQRVGDGDSATFSGTNERGEMLIGNHEIQIYASAVGVPQMMINDVFDTPLTAAELWKELTTLGYNNKDKKKLTMTTTQTVYYE